MAVDRPFLDGAAGPEAAAREAAVVAASQWELPPPTLLRAGMNATYVAGDVVLRVAGASVHAEGACQLATVLAEHGVRVARPARTDVVRHGPRSVTAWERLVVVDRPADWRAIGSFVAVVHALDPKALPAGVPCPEASRFPWWQFDELVDDIGGLLDGAARRGMEATIARHRGWADDADLVVNHGDVHPGNVVTTAEGPVLIDWDLLCAAPRGWDHAMLVRAGRWEGYDPSWYDEFAAGYGEDLRGDPVTVSIAELRLVAATLLRLEAGRHDPLAAAEAARRLAFWRGDADAPRWRAQ